MQDDFRFIPLDQLCEAWAVLRVVNRGSVEYLELRDSIADRGLLNSICVRPSTRKPGKFEIVDGLYRYMAAVELQLSGLPCIVKYNLTDADVLAAQIQANALRPETTIMEYARQLKRIAEVLATAEGHDLSIAQLSARIHKNPEWVGNQLALLNLIGPAQQALERGEIPLLSAYALARVFRSHQLQFVEQAKTMPAKEFVPIVNEFTRRCYAELRRGKRPRVDGDFTPVPYLRKLLDVKDEYEHRRIGALFLATAGCKTPLDAWYLALKWVLNLDEESVMWQRERFVQRQKTAVLERMKEEKESEP
jgi:ParB/RepB/Spo0J family partition protein